MSIKEDAVGLIIFSSRHLLASWSD